MKQRCLSVIKVVILAVTTMFYIGCRGGEGPKREHVRLLLDWKPGAEHAFLYSGKKFFENEGVDIEIVPGTGSSGSANMVDAKTVEFALCSAESAIQARSAATPRRIVALAIFYTNTPTVIYALESKGINNPTDLYGKKLGILKGSSAYRNYEAFARMIRLDRTRITEIPCTGDIREVLGPTARLDAMVHFGFQHPLQLQLQGYNVSVIRLRDFGIKIYGQGLITHEDIVEKRPDLVKRVVRAVQLSYQASLSDPDKVLEDFLIQVPGQDPKYAKVKLEWVNEFVRSGIPDGAPIGYHDEVGWESTRQYLSNQGLLERDLVLSALWTTQFLDQTVIIK